MFIIGNHESEKEHLVREYQIETLANLCHWPRPHPPPVPILSDPLSNQFHEAWTEDMPRKAYPWDSRSALPVFPNQASIFNSSGDFQQNNTQFYDTLSTTMTAAGCALEEDLRGASCA